MLWEWSRSKLKKVIPDKVLLVIKVILLKSLEEKIWLEMIEIKWSKVYKKKRQI